MQIYRKSLYDADFIIVATMTPDYQVASTASRGQASLGIPNAGTTDISCTCTGFCYALISAKRLIASMTHNKFLVIGADTMSKILDFSDRSSCILFGYAAGAVLIDAVIINCVTGTEGEQGMRFMCLPQGRILAIQRYRPTENSTRTVEVFIGGQ